MSSIGIFSYLQLLDTDIDHSFRDLPGASSETSHLPDRQVGPFRSESYNLRFRDFRSNITGRKDRHAIRC